MSNRQTTKTTGTRQVIFNKTCENVDTEMRSISADLKKLHKRAHAINTNAKNTMISLHDGTTPASDIVYKLSSMSSKAGLIRDLLVDAETVTDAAIKELGVTCKNTQPDTVTQYNEPRRSMAGYTRYKCSECGTMIQVAQMPKAKDPVVLCENPKHKNRNISMGRVVSV